MHTADPPISCPMKSRQQQAFAETTVIERPNRFSHAVPFSALLSLLALFLNTFHAGQSCVRFEESGERTMTLMTIVSENFSILFISIDCVELFKRFEMSARPMQSASLEKLK